MKPSLRKFLVHFSTFYNGNENARHTKVMATDKSEAEKQFKTTFSHITQEGRLIIHSIEPC